MRPHDQSTIFSTGGKFRPDYGLLLELHALTLVTHTYAGLVPGHNILQNKQCLVLGSLGPRPKTNPSADRFQYRTLYWKRYGLGTRLDWVPILNYIQFSPRTKDTLLTRTMILVPRMSILEGYVPMYTQPFTMCLVRGQAHPPTVDDTTIISGRCGSLIVQVYI